MTAILAEVSIAGIKESRLNIGMSKMKIQLNREHLNQTTRVWFLGYTVPPQYEGEDEYYTVKVACFEDLEYFDRLVVYK